jgi:ABC-2 type transport system permease protein
MGTMEVLSVSPLTQSQIIFGKVLPYLLLSFINGCLIIAPWVWVLDMPMNGNLPLLLTETLLFIFLSLSIGIFISTLTDSQLVAMFASLVILLMPTIFLSGFIFPIESMPKPLQVVSNIIPAKYFIAIVKGIMIKGVGIGYLLKETLILLAMAGLFIFLSLRKLKTRSL